MKKNHTPKRITICSRELFLLEYAMLCTFCLCIYANVPIKKDTLVAFDCSIEFSSWFVPHINVVYFLAKYIYRKYLYQKDTLIYFVCSHLLPYYLTEVNPGLIVLLKNPLHAPFIFTDSNLRCPPSTSKQHKHSHK